MKLPLYDKFGLDDQYLAGDGLRNAVNVALVLRRPLLLTGKPGTGKTTFAEHLHERLSEWYKNNDPTVKVEYNCFNTRSTSTASELFYKYDAIRRFHDRQNQSNKGSGSDGDPGDVDDCNSALPYLRLGALGLAIARAATKTDRENVLNPQRAIPFGDGSKELRSKLSKNHPDYESIVFKDGEPEKKLTVVLIDEVDKAPRDFPNDILNILEDFAFEIPELGTEQKHYKIMADKAWKPIVIFTSNSEKNLPEAFLRRCAYHDIPLPGADAMEQIVNRKLQADSSLSEFVSDAVTLWEIIRKQGGVYSHVSTGELLDWIKAMRDIAAAEDPRAASPNLQAHGFKTLAALLKAGTDKDEVLKPKFAQWMAKLPEEKARRAKAKQP